MRSFRIERLIGRLLEVSRESQDRCCDSAARIGFSITYKTAGTAKRRVSHWNLLRQWVLWVELWVGR
jgi:hypothetical protein